MHIACRRLVFVSAVVLTAVEALAAVLALVLPAGAASAAAAFATGTRVGASHPE